MENGLSRHYERYAFERHRQRVPQNNNIMPEIPP